MFSSTFFFFIALLPFLGMSQNCGKCSSGFTHLSKWKKCYRAFNQSANWDDAFKTCKDLNSHLVVVQSADDKEAIKEMITSAKSDCLTNAIYSAGRRYCSTDEFRWATGPGNQWKMSFTNWYSGEPNNVLGNEDCIRMETRYNLQWVDEVCSVKYCFICEIDI